jgi:IS30 family transposase
MEGMGLSKSETAALLGKHPGSIYRELSRNGTGGVYTGSEAQRAAEQRRLNGKLGPKLGSPALTEKILDMFKDDLSPDQIAGHLRALYPGQARNAGLHTGRLPLFIRENGNRPLAGGAFPAKTGKTTPEEGIKRPPGADT